MNLVIITALIAVSGAAKLDRTYLPPASAKTAGGTSGNLQTPFTDNQGLGSVPKGGFANEFQGVVVDAVTAGTRASGPEETGLGAPRISYGSTASKVGEAAFTAEPSAGFSQLPDGTQTGFGLSSLDGQIAGSRTVPQSFGQGFQSFQARAERPQAPFERTANTLKFESEVGPESFSYSFETDNGISAEENGLAINGVQAEGAFSYTGDDGQVYSVSYTADEGGYQPRGDHLPTPPPIPEEILKSLEQNAKEEAAGIVDDGSYDAQKYNAGGDYTESDSNNGQYNERQSAQTEDRPESDAVSSSTFINQNNQPVGSSSTNRLPGLSQPFSDVQPTQNRFTSSEGTANNNFIQGQLTQATGSRFGSSPVSANKFGSKNGYLPPRSGQNGKPAQDLKPTGNIANAAISQINQEETQPSDSFQPLNQNGNRFAGSSSISSSAFSSGSQPNNRAQSSQQFTSFQQQSQASLGGKQNQFTQSTNGRLPFNQANRQFQFGLSASNVAQANGAQNAQPSAQTAFSSTSFNSQHSTVQPQTELTTPHESKQKSSQQNSADSSQPFGHTTSSAFASFNSQPTRGRPSLAQFGSQNGFDQQNTQDESQTPTQTSSFASYNSQSSSTRPVVTNSRPFGSSNIQNTQSSTFPNQFPVNQGQIGQSSGADQQSPNIQNNQNRFNDVQYSSSTQRPIFSQNLQQTQSQDDSYYYNQPSRPLNIPSSQLQGFPSSISNQFNRGNQQPSYTQSTAQFSTGSQGNIQSTSFPSQNGDLQGSTRYPRPPTLSPVAPTTPTENEIGQNSFSNQFNGITQASASSFTSGSPTPSSFFSTQTPGQLASRPILKKPSNSIQLNNQGHPQPSTSLASKNSFAQATSTAQSFPRRPSQPNQFGQKPSSFQSQSQFSQPDSFRDQATQATPTQQYDGEIYEYNKPAEILPVSSQQDTTSTSEQSSQKTQTSQLSANRQPSQFGQMQGTQSQISSSEQFGSRQPTQQTHSSFSGQTSNLQFGQNTRPTQGSQFSGQTQTSSSPQFGSRQPTQQTFASTSSSGEQTSTSQFSHNSQPTQGIPFSGQGQISSNSQFGSRQPSRTTLGSTPSFNGKTFGLQAGQNTQLTQSQFSGQSQSGQVVRPGIDLRNQFVSGQSTQGGLFNAEASNTETEGSSSQSGNQNRLQTKCCQGPSSSPIGQVSAQSSAQFGRPDQSFDAQNQFDVQNTGFPGVSFKPDQTSSQSFVGKGEVFGGPRKPPSFDEKTGYHY